ncbi:TPA: tyrosine-type recombinase/integrase [Pseudomonas aeruginosa]|nr:tyrosine-type recombinase/integrase [Pseudomonas aeruginosa]HCH9960851.1 tyrosine-type recombinase/integrase [Pseudomonas aeruginosa]HCI3570959.1 tyrosine-type recombinase/integrase [Pseudomonas aeruginosa]HCJ0549429.1 tyrosine-type recombinase/integrase [Pseudomonas aeruginosa]HCJ0836097.1 tyrosine-type recombinase/integrase [Pseudomonas aeruginosa]
MAKIKLTKSVVDTTQAQTCDVELRDTLVPGFLCKVTPTGRKVFMVQYRTNSGVRRKPALGQFGELTVEQARSLAQDWLAEVRRGGDPGRDKTEARQAPTVKQLCGRFMEDHSKVRNKPSTQAAYQYHIDRYIIPAFGGKKVHEVTRHDIIALMKHMEKSPTQANRVLSCVRKMFNLAELWCYRPDGSNPCRHVSKYPEKGSTRLITDGQMVKLFAYLDKAEAEELEHPTYLLAIRLQFEFAARMSEILLLQWDWLDLPNSRVVWPDSKTGDMSKPLSMEARRLLENAPRYGESPYVCPATRNHGKPLSPHSYYNAWRRILDRAGVPRIGTHGIRHRSATDIANSGIPVKVGMALTAHKTVAMFMRYVHTEDDPVRKAAELVANRRKTVVSARQKPKEVTL